MKSNNKKIVALFCLVCVCLLALSGCGGRAAGKVKDLAEGQPQISVLAPSAYAAALSALTPKFEKSSGINVQLEFVGWDELHQRIQTACKAGQAPADLTAVRWDWVGELGRAAWYEPLNHSLPLEYWQNSLGKEALQYNGKYLAANFNNNFLLALGDKQQFAAAGIKPIPVDAGDLLTAAKGLKVVGAVEYPLAVSLDTAPDTAALWFALTKSMGGELFDENYQPQFLAEKSTGYLALSWLTEAWQAGLINPAALAESGEQIEKAFANGQGSLLLTAQAVDLARFFDTERGENLQVLPLPGGQDQNCTYGLAEGFGIPSASQNKEAAAAFLQWLNEPLQSRRLYQSYGVLPANKQALQQLTEEGKLPGDVAVLNIAATVRPLFPQGAPDWYQAWAAEISPILHRAVQGEIEQKAALEAIGKAVERLQKAALQ